MKIANTRGAPFGGTLEAAVSVIALDCRMKALPALHDEFGCDPFSTVQSIHGLEDQ